MTVVALMTFDTLAYVKRLTRERFPENQAQALAEAQKQVLAEAVDHSLATKDDLKDAINQVKEMIRDLREELNGDIYRIEKEVHVMRWMMGFLLLGMSSLIIKTFLG